jgi:hypothetical protein
MYCILSYDQSGAHAVLECRHFPIGPGIAPGYEEEPPSGREACVDWNYVTMRANVGGWIGPVRASGFSKEANIGGRRSQLSRSTGNNYKVIYSGVKLTITNMSKMTISRAYEYLTKRNARVH